MPSIKALALGLVFVSFMFCNAIYAKDELPNTMLFCGKAALVKKVFALVPGSQNYSEPIEDVTVGRTTFALAFHRKTGDVSVRIHGRWHWLHQGLRYFREFEETTNEIERYYYGGFRFPADVTKTLAYAALIGSNTLDLDEQYSMRKVLDQKSFPIVIDGLDIWEELLKSTGGQCFPLVGCVPTKHYDPPLRRFHASESFGRTYDGLPKPGVEFFIYARLQDPEKMDPAFCGRTVEFY